MSDTQKHVIETRMFRNKDTIQAKLNDTITVQLRIYKYYNGEVLTSLTGWQTDAQGSMTHLVTKDYSKPTNLGVNRLTKKLINTEFEKFINNWPSIRKDVMAFYKIES